MRILDFTLSKPRRRVKMSKKRALNVIPLDLNDALQRYAANMVNQFFEQVLSKEA